MKRIGVLTSGGDAPGMNAAVRSVVRYGIDSGFEVYGIDRGFEGLIDGEFHEMSRRSVGDILQRGGTILKTARSARFMTEEGMDRALESLENFGIDALVVIGGNGSFNGALKLSQRGINVIAVPGTIDNDLAYTEQTIGFDTAVNTVLEAVTRLRDTSSAHERTTVIEVMGRECGDIALYSALAGGAEYVLLPEVKGDLDDLCSKVSTGINEGKQHSIIIRAEGADISSADVIKTLSERTGREVKLVVLSYLQRGGSPTLRDRLLAINCGDKAVELLRADIADKAVGLVGDRVVSMDLEEALSKKSHFDRKMYEAIGILSK